MPRQEITLQNFSGGLQGQKMFGRYRLAVYDNGCRNLDNFLLQVQGGADYRTGFNFINHTRLNQIANLKRFEFNDIQSYVLEFTDKKLRFFRNEGAIVEADVTITGITQADPGVVTATAHGYSDGDEVFIRNVDGMTEVNGKSFLVANKAVNTFELTDVDGVDVDTTGFTAYSANGVCQKIVEIDTPYEEARDLFKLQIAQTADFVYIVHPLYEPRKLTRTDHTVWSLDLFDRVNDPLLSKKVITAITQANPGVVTTSGAHGFSDGDIVFIEAVVGMTEVNGRIFKVANKTGTTFELTDFNGVNVDTTGFGAYISDGYASDTARLPQAVTFYESRLWYGGYILFPDRFDGSQTPGITGATRYDDFTSGTADDNAVQYFINDSEVNKIFWLSPTDRVMIAGTFGSEAKITGETSERAITPTSINVRPLNKIGVQNVVPVNRSNIIFYVQRGGLTVKNFILDPVSESFVPDDLNLVADDITTSGIKQMAWQTGRPDVLWALRNDGTLLGLTYSPVEKIAGWHKHTTGGTIKDKFLSVMSLPRPSSFEQLWAVVEREIDGNTRREVSFLSDVAVLPREDDFFTGKANKAADLAKFNRAMVEAQKEYIHVDSALTYDGTAFGTDAVATLTPAAVTGNPITFTAGAAVFTSDMVGRQLWKKAIDGVGAGRAEIVTFTNSTTVECNIIQDFDNTDAMAAGDWYLTTDSLGNVDHLEARVVVIITDGALHPDKTVTNGAISLNYQSSKIHVGLGYTGFLRPMSLEFGGGTGPAQTKNKHIHELGFRFLETLGPEGGTDLYKPTFINFRKMPLKFGESQNPFTGVIPVPFNDSWGDDKLVYIRQNRALPCKVQTIMIYGETDDN